MITRTPETPADVIAGGDCRSWVGVSWRRWLTRSAPSHARPWLKDATLEDVEGEWVLITATRFNADWIRAHFDQALRQAAQAVGLHERRPCVRARAPPALPR